jgi:hypothetical protein
MKGVEYFSNPEHQYLLFKQDEEKLVQNIFLMVSDKKADQGKL